MTLIIEKPNADAERTTRTPGSPCRLTVNGYVIWSSTSCGDRPDQSENTITWLSERSGMASIGVVKSAQYPQAPMNRKRAITMKRFRSATSISQLITCSSRGRAQPCTLFRIDAYAYKRSSMRTDYELRGEESGSGRRIRQGPERAGKAFWGPRRHAGHRKEYVADGHVTGRAGRDSTRPLAHRAHPHAIIRRHGERGGQRPHGDGDHGNDSAPTIHRSLTITRSPWPVFERTSAGSWPRRRAERGERNEDCQRGPSRRPGELIARPGLARRGPAAGGQREPRGRGVRAVCRLSLSGARRPPHGPEPRARVGPARRERRGVHALLRTAQARRRRLGRGDARPLARGPSDRRPAQPHDVPRAEGRAAARRPQDAGPRASCEGDPPLRRRL